LAVAITGNIVCGDDWGVLIGIAVPVRVMLLRDCLSRTHADYCLQMSMNDMETTSQCTYDRNACEHGTSSPSDEQTTACTVLHSRRKGRSGGVFRMGVCFLPVWQQGRCKYGGRVNKCRIYPRDAFGFLVSLSSRWRGGVQSMSARRDESRIIYSSYALQIRCDTCLLRPRQAI